MNLGIFDKFMQVVMKLCHAFITVHTYCGGLGVIFNDAKTALII